MVDKEEPTLATGPAPKDEPLEKQYQADEVKNFGAEASETSWKAFAGRTAGREGYQFGDISRGLLLRAKTWAEKPKQREGYEFGDLLLKPLLRFVGFPQAEAEARGADAFLLQEPAPTPEQCSLYEETGARLSAQRLEAQEALETNIPLLEARLLALRTSTELDALGASELVRLSFGFPGPMAKYQSALDDLRFSLKQWHTLDAAAVQQMAAAGTLHNVEAAVGEALKISEECAQCAQEVRAV